VQHAVASRKLDIYEFYILALPYPELSNNMYTIHAYTAFMVVYETATSYGLYHYNGSVLALKIA